MTQHIKPVNWTELLLNQQRCLIALLGQLAYRCLTGLNEEELNDECSNKPLSERVRQNSRPSS